MVASKKTSGTSTRGNVVGKKTNGAKSVKPVGKKPVGKKPVGKKPIGKKPVGKKPTSNAAPRSARVKPTVQAQPATHARSGLLGTIVVPSGRLTVIDIGLLEYIALDTLQPGLLAIAVPKTTLKIFGESNGRSGTAATWQRITISAEAVAPTAVVASRLLGHVPIDLAQLAAIDAVALASWQHDVSNDGKADLIFWGKDAAGLAALLAAPSHRDGYGWRDVTLTQAEQFADKIASKKHDHHWQVSAQIRPHSDYFRLAEVARASDTRTGSAPIGASTAWLGLSMPTGAFPVFIDDDAKGQWVQVRIEFSAEARF